MFGVCIHVYLNKAPVRSGPAMGGNRREKNKYNWPTFGRTIILHLSRTHNFYVWRIFRKKRSLYLQFAS